MEPPRVLFDLFKGQESIKDAPLGDYLSIRERVKECGRGLKKVDSRLV